MSDENGRWLEPQATDFRPAVPAPREGPPSGSPAPDLSLWWIGFVAVAVGFLTVGSVAAVLMLATGAEEPTPAMAIGTSYFQNVLFVALAFAGARIAGAKVPRVALGLTRPARPLRAAGIVLLAMVVYLVASAAYGAAVGIKEGSENTVDTLGFETSTTNLIFAGLLVTVAAPLAEEILFRGLLFGALWSRFGAVAALLSSGVLFGLMHIGGGTSLAIPVLGVLGALFAFVYYMTGSLVPAISMHAINNGIALTAVVAWGPALEALMVAGVTAVTTLIAWLISAPARSVLPRQ